MSLLVVRICFGILCLLEVLTLLRGLMEEWPKQIGSSYSAAAAAGTHRHWSNRRSNMHD
jgi:hypothetical protein